MGQRDLMGQMAQMGLLKTGETGINHCPRKIRHRAIGQSAGGDGLAGDGHVQADRNRMKKC